MPDTTPIYGFPYPCPDEVISPMAFTNLANAIDAKLAEVNADMVFALNRPNFDFTSGAGQVINPGVNTTLTMASSTYTVTVAGVWVLWVNVLYTATPPTITFQNARIRLNGVDQFGFSNDTENNNTIPVRVVGPVVAAAGDVITTTFLYTGTGTASVVGLLSGKLICRIP